MLIDNLNSSNKTIDVSLPMTAPSGKVRVKERNSMFDYGKPFASKQKSFNQKNYIEWQISYDTTKENKNFQNSTLQHIKFQGAKGKWKSFYELSEYLYYFCKWGVFNKSQLSSLRNFIAGLGEHDLLDKHEHCQISRTDSQLEKINQTDFYKLTVKYPQLIYRFKQEIIAEITIREKQRAIGTQPMLYFCFPVTELKSGNEPLIDRCAKAKECACFEFNQKNAFIVLEMVKIFGMLSPSHRTDRLQF